MLNGNDAASAAFDKAVEKYSQVLNRLNLRTGFVIWSAWAMCVIRYKSFHASGHDMNCWASALFNLNAGQVEIEILTLQNDLHLKAHQSASNFWCFVDREKYSNLFT